MNIFDFVGEKVNDYRTNEITIVDGYDFNQYETLKRAELYTNSRYEEGQLDSLGRRKPFFNIITKLLNKQRTAEEIDTKDISLETTRPQHYAKSFVMTLCNRMWMNMVNFAQTLNDMTETRGKHGGVLVKKVINEDGIMNMEVVDWQNVITDPADIHNGVKIERHFYTPSKLKEQVKNGWDEEAIDQAIAKSAEDNQNKEEENEKRDTMGDYIEVFEVHGELPTQMIDEDAEDGTYSHQMQVIVVAGSGDDIFEGVLYSENNTEHPYKYLPYRKTSRRDLGIGIPEEATEAQIWTNDAKKKEKDAMDFAGKVFLQSADSKFKGKNVFKNIQNGTILQHASGKPITGMNVTPGGLPQFQNMVTEWNRQVSDATSVQDVNVGATMPSQTPFRLGAILNQEANSIFELRREEMGIFLCEIYKEWIIPFLKELIQDEEYIVAKLSPEELKVIQKDYVQKVADQNIKKKMLNGAYDNLPAETKWIFIDNDRNNERIKVQEGLKGKNFIKVPDGWLDNVEFELDVVITNEQRIKQVYLETLSNIMTTVAQNPQILNDPRLKKLFDQIMETAGYSPLEFDQIEAQEVPETAVQEEIEAPEVGEETANVV